jgi:glycerol 3-phosphatase-2
MLKSCGSALWEQYDLAMLDLDGVVYVGEHAVPGAPEELDRARRAGMHLAYITNNASRPPSVVADHLRTLGIPADDGDVVTSAQAAARLVAAQVEPGSAVFVIGGTGLFEALTELDLKPVQSLAEDALAVVSGYHPELTWKTVIDGAILVRRGLPWVASNTDMTIPTPHGVGPGNGVLVRAVAEYAGRTPLVAGKPETPLFEETRLRVGGERPLVVGDRLDTDIAGAINAGLDSLLVMTGVTGVDELVNAEPALRPSYVCADLSGLGRPHQVPERVDDSYRLGGWKASLTDDRLEVTGDGPVDDWWRVLAAAGWNHLDTTGSAVDVSRVRLPGSVASEQDEDAVQHTQEDGDQK